MPQWETRKRRWKRKPYRARYAQAHRAKRKALAPAVAAGLYNAPGASEPILPPNHGILGIWMATVFATRGLSIGIRVTAPRGGTVQRLVIARSASCSSSGSGRGRASGEPDVRSAWAAGSGSRGPPGVLAGLLVVIAVVLEGGRLNDWGERPPRPWPWWSTPAARRAAASRTWCTRRADPIAPWSGRPQ